MVRTLHRVILAFATIAVVLATPSVSWGDYIEEEAGCPERIRQVTEGDGYGDTYTKVSSVDQTHTETTTVTSKVTAGWPKLGLGAEGSGTTTNTTTHSDAVYSNDETGERILVNCTEMTLEKRLE